ncbi:squalene/phytoene synthase family protein [Phenylobacterium sp.]|uniref:squalene/phytoene synthase family protein n=1 Tax=Phenylobacterium sp. TaxID=1871053 RepID=UPI002C313732|nr:squalene/phytoene synthase family protein [Phenylobacterium sp.]HVI33131.1 squalene/phytoene synthase family protein [Phenylobacterium sp.]
MSDDAVSDTGDLDALLRRVDPDRWLSSRFVGDREKRADVVAIYAFDHELARAPKVASNPLLGEIRLAWWREVLDEVYEGRPVRRHPTAQALAQAIRRRSLPREPLEAMIDARYRELDASPMSVAEALEWARDTGGLAAELAARILDPAGDTAKARGAGSAWALSRRAREQPVFAPTVEKLLGGARTGAKTLSVAAFPAVAHAVFVGRSDSEVARRLRLIWAVARGRL